MLVSIIMLTLAVIGTAGIIGASCGIDQVARKVALPLVHANSADIARAFADIDHALTYHDGTPVTGWYARRGISIARYK